MHKNLIYLSLIIVVSSVMCPDPGLGNILIFGNVNSTLTTNIPADGTIEDAKEGYSTWKLSQPIYSDIPKPSRYVFSKNGIEQSSFVPYDSSYYNFNSHTIYATYYPDNGVYWVNPKLSKEDQKDALGYMRWLVKHPEWNSKGDYYDHNL